MHRYAVYFGPRPGEPLHDFGKSWLGTDPESGAAHSIAPLPGFDADAHAAMVADPRRYALHGTLKPPFVLADGTDVDSLGTALSGLARRLSPVTLAPMRLKRLSGFLALCPETPPDALGDLAATCVRVLDSFRAPPSDAELTRRRKAGLSARQETYLQDWGYPYVMEEFRFHVTLTNRLDEDLGNRVMTGLTPRLEPVIGPDAPPIVLRDLCLYAEAGDGTPFRVVARFPLDT